MFRRLLKPGRWPRPNQRLPQTREYATSPPKSTPESRISRIEARLPRFLRHFTTPLRNAPISHITAFLVLHELTAILPLFGLAALFHYSNWLPPYISEGKWVHEGTEKFGKWMRKKGWIVNENRGGRWWGKGEGGVRIVVELATAYAITKALLPLRLVMSVWGTPLFARWTVLPATAVIARWFARRPGVSAVRSHAAGTGATGGGVISSEAATKVK